VPSPVKSLMAWVIARPRFGRRELVQAFPSFDAAMIEPFLAEIVRMGIVEAES
jgi:hypothetical protein